MIQMVCIINTSTHESVFEIWNHPNNIAKKKKKAPTSSLHPFLVFEQEEEPAEYSEAGLLQEGVQPEEFVAIADYAATDETQVAMRGGQCFVVFSMFSGKMR